MACFCIPNKTHLGNNSRHLDTPGISWQAGNIFYTGVSSRLTIIASCLNIENQAFTDSKFFKSHSREFIFLIYIWPYGIVLLEF